MPVIVALVAALLFTVNDTDTLVIRNGSLRILFDQSPYALTEGIKSPFTSPPHIALIGLPFVILGARWCAFWNMFFSLPVIIGSPTNFGVLGAKLLFIFTPAFLYMMASANVTGIVTGIGLLLLFSRSSGSIRGLAWAFMLLRPQDSWAFLVYDGIHALRQRDYKAAITVSIVLLIPLLISTTIYEEWWQAMYYPLFVDNLPGYTLSLTGTDGFHATFLFISIVGLLRLFKWDPNCKFVLRKKADYSQAEVLWLLAVVTLTAGTYTAYYMIWLAFIILRDYELGRTLALFAITSIIGIIWMTDPNPHQIQTAMLVLIVVIAVLSPRTSGRIAPDAYRPKSLPNGSSNASSSMSGPSS